MPPGISKAGRSAKGPIAKKPTKRPSYKVITIRIRRRLWHYSIRLATLATAAFICMGLLEAGHGPLISVSCARVLEIAGEALAEYFVELDG